MFTTITTAAVFNSASFIVYLFALVFDTVFFEDTMHSDIPNYKQLGFNSLKIIQNDTVYQPADDRSLTGYFNT